MGNNSLQLKRWGFLLTFFSGTVLFALLSGEVVYYLLWLHLLNCPWEIVQVVLLLDPISILQARLTEAPRTRTGQSALLVAGVTVSLG